MKRKLQLKENPFLKQFCYLLFVFCLAGCCNIRLVSDYDEQTDKAATAFQRKIEMFFTFLEQNADKPEGKYEQNINFYNEAKVDLSSLRVRAAALPENGITVQQVDLLIDSLNNLEELHKTGLTREQIPPLRSAFNISCTAILKYELAKKRGE